LYNLGAADSCRDSAPGRQAATQAAQKVHAPAAKSVVG
jgi:hypothetical protein